MWKDNELKPYLSQCKLAASMSSKMSIRDTWTQSSKFPKTTVNKTSYVPFFSFLVKRLFVSRLSKSCNAKNIDSDRFSLIVVIVQSNHGDHLFGKAGMQTVPLFAFRLYRTNDCHDCFISDTFLRGGTVLSCQTTPIKIKGLKNRNAPSVGASRTRSYLPNKCSRQSCTRAIVVFITMTP